MKRILGIIVIAMAVILSSAVSAQNTGNSNLRCLNQISDLSGDQKEKITALSNDHQAKMTELRNERRSTTDLTAKEKIRKQMDLEKANHRSGVLNLLDKDQQVQYLALTSSGQGQYKKGNGCNKSGNNGKGNGQGQGQGKRGKGKGNCQGGNGNFQGGKGKYGSRGNS